MRTFRYPDLPPGFLSPDDAATEASVRDIMEAVRSRGDAALRELTSRFDGVVVGTFRVPLDQSDRARDSLPEQERGVLAEAAAAIGEFAFRQRASLAEFQAEIRGGVTVAQRLVPVKRVGVYVPGGRFPLPSTVLMCVIPARIAGVEEVVLCSPPSFQGSIHPAILAAASIAGVDEIYRVGGAQAVAALAWGTESIRPVDKIVGPGNRYVAAAKKAVYGRVGIEFAAGPTEVMIVADDSADPRWVAADLVAQAEHDADACPVLVTLSERLAHDVPREIDALLRVLPTAVTATESLARNGAIIIVNGLDQAVEIADARAPEHLQLHLADPQAHSSRFRNFGTLFIGAFTAEALGDYSSGLNHTLPTSRGARYTGGLGVRDFLKAQTTLSVSPAGLQRIGPTAVALARMEGLAAHALSVELRLDRT